MILMKGNREEMMRGGEGGAQKEEVITDGRSER